MMALCTRSLSPKAMLPGATRERVGYSSEKCLSWGRPDWYSVPGIRYTFAAMFFLVVLKWMGSLVTPTDVASAVAIY